MRDQLFKLAKTRFVIILRLYAGSMFELLDHRMQSSASMIWRTLVLQRSVRLLPDPLAQLPDHPALAETCFRLEQDNLPFTVPGIRPAVQQHTHFRVAANKGCDMPPVRFETSL